MCISFQTGIRAVCLLLFMPVTLLCTGQKAYQIKEVFERSPIPPAPDYSSENNWCALPWKEDAADLTPENSEVKDGQKNAQADVFFLHPTIFTYEPENEFLWNADTGDRDLNKRVDESTIKNQATVFNGSCKVYAPRYRQAHYSAFTSSDKESARKALDLAYEDVRQAFLYYMQHFNNGRPIVIASHSQGTVHAKRLLKEFFDNAPLKNQLVSAYLIGIAVHEDEFETLKASNLATETSGFVSWNTFIKDYFPPYYSEGLEGAVCTNPLTWKTEETYGTRFDNSGAVGLKFKMVKNAVDAENKNGLLWIHKPHVTGRIFLNFKIWHKADYNLYWMNIRENVALRVSTFLTNTITR